jgi:hypothetical protein
MAASFALWWALFLLIACAPSRQALYFALPSAAVIAGFALDAARRRFARGWPVLAVALALAALLAAGNGWRDQTALNRTHARQGPIAKVLALLQRDAPQALISGPVLLVNDPFPETWDLYLLARLHFCDPDLIAGVQSFWGGPVRGGEGPIWPARLVFEENAIRVYRLRPGDEE